MNHMTKRTRIRQVIDTLHLFEDKVQKLLGLKFVSEIRDQAGGAIAEYKQGKGWDAIFVGPSEETLDAVILTLRLFIRDNERISVRNVRRLYMESGLPKELRDEFCRVADHLNAQLDTPTNMSIKEGERLTFREVLQIFVYGSNAHTTPRWHRLYRDLKTTPFFPVLQHDFVTLGGLWARLQRGSSSPPQSRVSFNSSRFLGLRFSPFCLRISDTDLRDIKTASIDDRASCASR